MKETLAQARAKIEEAEELFKHTRMRLIMSAPVFLQKAKLEETDARELLIAKRFASLEIEARARNNGKAGEIELCHAKTAFLARQLMEMEEDVARMPTIPVAGDSNQPKNPTGSSSA